MNGEGPIQRTGSGRFPKGVSGNPKGRPRNSKSKKTPGSAYDVIVDKTLTVTKNGIARDVTVEEALQHKTYQQALDGSRTARREILRMILRREQALAKEAPSKASVVEVKIEYAAKNVDDAALMLGIGQPTGDIQDVWKLDTWAVQAALSRRRGGSRLTDLEIEGITQSSLEPETLVWPRGTGE